MNNCKIPFQEESGHITLPPEQGEVNERSSEYCHGRPVPIAVRVIFSLAILLQFYIPLIFCVSILIPLVSPESLNRNNEDFALSLHGIIITVVASTIVCVVLEYSLFFLFVRLLSFRIALGGLICVNVLHGWAWIMAGTPFTAFRLAIPTLLFILLLFMRASDRYQPENVVQTLTRLVGRVIVNVRAALFVIFGKWLTSTGIRDDYNLLAQEYDANWLVHLQSTTGTLLDSLASLPEAARILDLGCGTGWTTIELARRFPQSTVVGIDLSPGMLDVARSNGASVAHIEFREADLLSALKAEADESVDCVFSAWAIGYSSPKQIAMEAFRALKPGGLLAVVVNRLDTMPVVFQAFRHGMYHFPFLFRRAFYARFPRNMGQMHHFLEESNLQVVMERTGRVPIPVPERGRRLEWLFSTGILAGFDSILPIRSHARLRKWFARELDRSDYGWEHRYILFIARKPEGDSS